MTTTPSPGGPAPKRRPQPPSMSQPKAMKSKRYVSGIDTINGNDAWALFRACAARDNDRARRLLAKDPRLVNAQYWYRFPIHFAVEDGNAELVELLLEDGRADAGRSTFTYDSWHKLLETTEQRGFDDIQELLVRTLRRRFRYSPDFDVVKEAIVARNPRRVKSLLDRRSELARSSDALGNNGLHWCVITRQPELIADLVRRETPIDAERADGQTPVLLAVNGAVDYWYRETRGRTHPSLRNFWILAGMLLAHGARYSISVAAAAGDRERVERILRRKPELARELDSARLSPLSYAAREGHAHIVRLLLEHGADPNVPEEGAPDGRPLFEACMRNQLETAELLLQHGANPNAGLDSSGCCLTICEVYHGDRARPLQRLLRNFGAETPPYAMTTSELRRAIRDQRPIVNHDEFLGIVLEKNNAELLDRYLDARAGVLRNLQSGSGILYPPSPARARQLLAHGLDPAQRDWVGRTFLHRCAEHHNRSMAALFLEAGADINARDVQHRETPLATAIRCEPPAHSDLPPSRFATRRRQMVVFLLRRGAATELPGDPDWATPLHWARKKGLDDIVALLENNRLSTSR